VTNGAKLYGNDDTIGYGSSTNGGNNNTLLVTGPGSLYSNSEGLTIGNNTNGNGTNNSLVISNGAKAILGADGLSLGNYSGTNGNNTVLVTGTNSTLDSSAGGISIGAGENGDSITVTNGAKLYGNDDTIGYGSSTNGGNNNTLLVTDTNSLYSNSSDLNIGQGANGNTLIVTNGAHALVAGDTSIGTSGGSSNSITVTGPGSSLIVAGNIMVGTSSGNANYLTLDNGAFVSAATLTVYSNSVLSGNGTITTTADPTINGGTLAPTGTNALVINGNTTFTNNGTFVWNLFNNSTNNPSSGTNFTVPVILNGNLNVTNSTLDVVLNNLVSATNSFWRTPGVTNSWVIIQGTNASIGNGLNFNVNFLGQTTDFALTDFSLVTNRADQLVLNYFYNTNDVDTIVTNNGTTNVAVSPGVNNNVTQNGSGTTSLGGSGAASLAIVVNNGTLNTTNTTGVLSPLVNVTVNGGVFGIQAPGTNVVNNFTVNGGTVLSPSNVIVTVTNPSGMNITGGNLSGGTFQAADYIFSPATTSSVSATLENLNTNSWAVITNNSGGASGTTVFTTNMAYTGDTLITNATLQLGSGSSTGSVLGVITNYGVLDFGYNGNTNTPSNVVLGNGVIGQVGTGTLTIGTNGIGTSFTGSFAVANGTLAITTNSALGNSTNFYLANNGTLQATTGVTNITNANVTNGTGIIDNASGSTLTLNGTLKKSGTTLILTGGNFSVQGQITGSGTPGSFDSDLIISNATATLNAGNNNYVGPTTIEAGSGLSNGIVNALPTNTLLNVGALTDAAVTNTYNLAGYNQTLAGLASPTTASSTNQVTNSGAAAILKINGATNTVYAGTISGNLSMVRQGLGSTLLSGNNSYTGGTTINSGKLITANNNALGTGNVTLAGGTLQLNNILTISSFIWNSSTSTNSQVALPNASGANDYLNVTSTITRGSSISYFNLTGVTLNNTPTELLYFGTNLLTTGEFKVVGLTTHYKLFIENGDSLWINLNGTNNPTNGLTVYPTTTTVGNTATYSSATFLNNGILNITPTGNLTLTTNVAVNNNSTVILNGVLNVSNTLTIDPGSTLTGAGTLNGNLINSGFVGGPGNLTVTRNFIQNPTGTFILNPNGPSTSNKLKAGGSISLAGNLQVKPANGYVIQIGNSYNFLSAPGGISGNFAAIDMPSGYRGRFLKSDNNTLGTLLIAPQSYTQMAANRNQLNVASALNSFISATSGDQLVVSTSLDSLNASQYQEALNGILPNFYQSLATIAFNSANAQNSELLQRLWGLRVAEGGGFSMSGLPDNTAVIEGQGDGESPGKGVLDSKKDILRPGLDNHWGMFLDGNGIFAQANSANMLPGYTAESGGVTTGLTYKWNDNFGTGLYCGYEGTYAKYGTAGSGLGVGSSLIDNAVRFGVFGTYGQKNAKGEAVGFYANALAGGGYNNYQATRVIQYGTYGSPTSINRTASSSPGAGELDTMLAGGYDLKRGHWTYGPTASLQYTYLGVNPVNETGAQSLDFNSQSWNSQSLLSSVGAHAAYTWQANNDIVVVPQISLAWQHEFMQNPYAINGTLGGASPNFSNWSSAPIRDFLYTGVGVTVEFYKRWNASLFYNASVGNTDLTSENIFLSAGVKF
jgi:T5SS/PEP-CTERM-associated repeat protein